MMKGGGIAGLLIRQARLGRDWSQEGLCRGICAPSYLSKIEQGKAVPSPEVAKLLLYLAGEDAGYITGQVFGVNGGLVI